MSYYDSGPWSPTGRQSQWDSASPVSRPGPGNPPTTTKEDGDAFYYQFASMSLDIITILFFLLTR
jgi:hypothetical protein